MSWTILGVLTWIASTAPLGLKAALTAIKDEFPDFADAIDAILFKMSEGLAPENIAAAIADLPPEVINAIQLKFNPRFHPGDLA